MLSQSTTKSYHKWAIDREWVGLTVDDTWDNTVIFWPLKIGPEIWKWVIFDVNKSVEDIEFGYISLSISTCLIIRFHNHNLATIYFRSKLKCNYGKKNYVTLCGTVLEKIQLLMMPFYDYRYFKNLIDI